MRPRSITRRLNAELPVGVRVIRASTYSWFLQPTERGRRYEIIGRIGEPEFILDHAFGVVRLSAVRDGVRGAPRYMPAVEAAIDMITSDINKRRRDE